MIDDIKLLIIDDDEAIRLSFSDYFEDQGAAIRVAVSGEEALATMQSFAAQVAIVDIRMGGMSGDDFIRQAIEEFPGCCFIVCTGSPDYGAPIDLVRHPRVYHSIFTKPVTDLGQLKQAVKEMAS